MKLLEFRISQSGGLGAAWLPLGCRWSARLAVGAGSAEAPRPAASTTRATDSAQSSRYLAQVAERREPIEITDHGRPVARLVPVISDDWANLIAAAEVTPADPTIKIRDTEPLIATESASAILQRLREHER